MPEMLVWGRPRELLIAHRCRLVVTSPGHVVVVVLCCCPCAVLLLLAHCGPVLCLNKVGWGEGGTGGTYLASTMTNDGCGLSFWLPHRCRRRGTCIPHSSRQSFPSMGGRFHPWVAVFTYGWLFVFVAVVFVHLHLWLVVYIRGQSFAFVGSRFRCISWLVVGAVLSLLWAASFCGCCGG